ncbi:hypothetical protein RFM98_17605 [Mesorhizobium sp. VK9D]|uniref:hypothetical protein n=1 Tax=Mesorhizobium australafricanum TaxID=3072311 RepID=UPI002A24A2AA|nr:hypothetical protein [Mesorhizobium sp. VK9D]MDX8454579.1 hypothetical protein [Mesorhizobium sp. VK9D]
MARVPRWAEKLFSTACSDGDAVCSPPDEDINGWDFLIEFPDRSYSGPLERRPAKDVAFVQVKSKSGGKPPSATIKLSNVQIACASKQPWFLVAVTRDNKGSHRFYGLHVWSELMRKSLSAVRQAAVEEIQLNKKQITIRFPSDTEITGDVVAWMRSEIDAVQGVYGDAKHHLFTTLGYENGYGTATFTVQVKSEDEIANAFLGLGNGLATSTFKSTESRFGIRDPAPAVFGPGNVFITPEPTDECEVRVRGNTGEPTLVLTGVVFDYAFPVIALERRKSRIFAPPIEMILGGDGQRKFSIEIPPEKKFSLDYLSIAGKISRWAALGPIDVIARRPNQDPLEYTVTFNDTLRGKDGTQLSCIMDAIQLVTRHSPTDGISFSINDMRGAIKDLGYFYQVLQNGSMRLVLKDPSDAPRGIASFKYYTGAKIAEWSFYAIVQRKVQSDLIVDSVRQITASSPVVIETYVFKDVNDGQLARIQSDYSRISEEIAGDGSDQALLFGNIANFIQSSNM